MGKIKILLLFAAYCFISTSLSAQYFDWVKTFGYFENYTDQNYIQQSAIDTNGNLYFVGSYTAGAGIDGQDFLPFTPYGYKCRTRCALLGKISPHGELLWYKTIHTNDGGNVPVKNIYLIGDSAIMCNFLVYNLGGRPTSYIYYLDTLISTQYSDGLNYYCPYDIVRGGGVANIFTTFDLNGNLIENHSIDVLGVTNNGDTLRYYYGPSQDYIDSTYYGLSLSGYNIPSFCVDKDGNIIICRELVDKAVYNYHNPITDTTYNITYSVSNGDISELIFIVDGIHMHSFTPPDIRPAGMPCANYQLLKFSPHFEKLIASQYIFKPTVNQLDSALVSSIGNIIVDEDNNVFLTVSSYINSYLTHEDNSNTISLQIDGIEQTIDFDISGSVPDTKSIMIKYNSQLTPEYIKFLRSNKSPYDSSVIATCGLVISGVTDDDDLILSGYSCISHSEKDIFFYYDSIKINSCNFNGTRALNKSIFFLRINPQNGELLAQGNACCSWGAGASPTCSAKNNRIITQISYVQDISFADTAIFHDTQNLTCMGLAVWDYNGKQLFFLDYNACGGRNRPCDGVYLHDSILYLTGMIYSGADFGGNILYPSTDSRGYIAKYVDTAFMNPYMGSFAREDIQLVVRDGEPLFIVYPNPCAQRVTVEWDAAEPPVAASLTDMTGRTHNVSLSRSGEGRYSIDFSHLPAANYLLTLTTASGLRTTSRILKRM